jgi:predicted KAP-like P-loop ATPase
MPNKVGELQKVLKKLADAGINIIETYGSTGTGRSSACVFSTSDNTKAIRIINK